MDFQMSGQINFCANFFSQTSHWKDFSPVWNLRWELKPVFWVNRCPHQSHWKSFSPVWILRWAFKLFLRENCWSQQSHLKTFSFALILPWFFNLLFELEISLIPTIFSVAASSTNWPWLCQGDASVYARNPHLINTNHPTFLRHETYPFLKWISQWGLQSKADNNKAYCQVDLSTMYWLLNMSFEQNIGRMGRISTQNGGTESATK